MSRGRSFNKEITSTKSILEKKIENNFDYLFEELQTKDMETKIVEIFFRDKNFVTTSYRHSLESHTSNRSILLSEIKSLFLKHYNSETLYRSTGVVFSALKKKNFHQMNIFEKKSLNPSLDEVIYNINKKY
jgi:hypothetical protein